MGFVQRSRLFLKVLTDKAAVDPISGGYWRDCSWLVFSAFLHGRLPMAASSLGALLGIVTAIGVAAPELRALGTLNAVAQEGGGGGGSGF